MGLIFEEIFEIFYGRAISEISGVKVDSTHSFMTRKHVGMQVTNYVIF